MHKVAVLGCKDTIDIYLNELREKPWLTSTKITINLLAYLCVIMNFPFLTLVHNIIFILQTPSGTPNPGEGEGIDISNPFEMIVFVIIPILLIAFYFLLRRKNKRQ